jgi:hypothetical protein
LTAMALPLSFVDAPPSRDEIQGVMIDHLEEIRRAGRRTAILQSATGTGKTVVAAKWILKGRERAARTLFLAHRDILINQASRQFAGRGITFAVEQAERSAAEAMSMFGGIEVVVGSKDSMQGARLQKWHPDRFTDIIIDECFPTGTLVDGKQIESLRTGQMVRSYNHWSNEVEWKRVVATSSRSCQTLVKVHLSDGTSLVCTPNHPVYAGDPDLANVPDYRMAHALSGRHRLFRMVGDHPQFGDQDASRGEAPDRELRGVREGVRPPAPEHERGVGLLAGVQAGPAGQAEGGSGDELHDLRQADDARRAQADGGDQERQGALLGRMPAGHETAECRHREGELRPGGVEPSDEATESDERPGGEGNGKGPSGPQRLLAEALGWPMEHAVRTGMPRGSGYPPCYKMDIADPTLKVAVEVDGGSHNNKLGRQRDRKKDDFLRSLGWCVLRFSNKDVMRNLTGCVQTVESTTSRLRTTTTTSSTACSSTTATCRPPPRS